MKHGIIFAVILTICLTTALAVAQTKVVVVPLGGKKLSGDAVAADVLEGKTFSNKDEVGIPGSMVNNGAITITPGTSDHAVPEGYHNGSGTVQGDTDLVHENIKTGTSIFGVSGTAIEASGTATSNQVLAGQTFSNASGSATGAMPDVGAQNITPGTTDQVISQGYHNGLGNVAGDAGLVSGNIRSGVTLFGVAGDSNVVNTASGDATAGEVLGGKKAWVDGAEINGAMQDNGAMTFTPGNSDQVLPAGYYNGSGTVKGDANLIASNIVCGKTIFGVVGTLIMPGTVCSAGQLWTDRNLGASQVATSQTDVAAYGDLYQWGRWSDGHQLRTSPTTTTLSATDAPGHGSFILTTSFPNDWRSPRNDNLWQGVSGINNPCPAGFRLPTEVEWEAERATWSSIDSAGAFASPLKLVLAGYRNFFDGTLVDAGSSGVYWSSTVNGGNSSDLFSNIFYVGIEDYGNNRAYGFSVRCLRD